MAGDTRFRPKALCIDLETARNNALKVWKLGAWRADTNQSVLTDGKVDFGQLRPRLDALAVDAAFLVGHNIKLHDLPVLKALCPELRLHGLKVVDTLELSPIAFPANPYHRLVKDYKLVKETRNDPLQDAKLALSLWMDQFAALSEEHARHPNLVAAYHFLLADDGLDSFFTTIRRAFAPESDWFAEMLPSILEGKVCPHQLQELLPSFVSDVSQKRAFVYALAWLSVAGGNSVLPPWVRLTHPQLKTQLTQLRETTCQHVDCPYCSSHLDVLQELKKFFGFDQFRPSPITANGGSLQEAIIRAGYAGQSILAILPTGGGKSICYQLPALSRYWRNGGLTIVVSPLQSLMKDQVDNLIRAGITSAATLNGMLSMPERQDVLEKIRLGDISILLVSPEQFRNPAFTSAIAQREVVSWVFDEAHCLSKWGHDFRTDYMYVTRFIRENYKAPYAPICAFTATAKKDVVADLCSHFRETLSIDLQVMDGGVERANLHYEVLTVEQSYKRQEILSLLRHELADGGGAVVFVSSRTNSEEIAQFLSEQTWRCQAFHAGLDPMLKKQIQQDFIDGHTQVIVATNAFGMGVDKQDIRLVVHADIPGSLENYLQEAGRAGRDQQDARCVLLYCKEDVERQFGLALNSRLTRQDIAGILRMLKRHAAKNGSNEMVLTSGEILKLDADTNLNFDPEANDTDTRIRTALYWLETAGLIERNENRTQVFSASLKVPSLAEAIKSFDGADLAEGARERYVAVVSYLLNLDDDEAISTDEMTQALGLTVEECIAALRGLEKLKILSNDLSISCWLRKGIADASRDRLIRVLQLEKALLSLMREEAPDATTGEWYPFSMRMVCQRLRDESGGDVLPEQVQTLLRSLAHPIVQKGRGENREFMQIVVSQRENLRIKLLKDWGRIEEMAERCQLIAQVLLTHLEGKVPEGVRGGALHISVTLGQLADALAADMTISSLYGDAARELAAVNAGLMFLHENQVLILDKGKAIFRPAMALELLPDSKGRGFRDNDFSPLRAYYQDKTLQIHVMQEYARLGISKIADALSFVLAYFTMDKMDFIRRYFDHRREEIERAATQESWMNIVGNLKNPEQSALVTAPENSNMLVLAGPGSGKTRVIVHRVAYLIRIKGVPASGILVLAYNRAAAIEIRERLYALLGAPARAVTVLTYHALALRLTGRSLALSDGSDTTFSDILKEATQLLTGGGEVPGQENDSLRDSLLAGYRYILVDEYQDIDQDQYALIAALGGRTLDRDEQLSLMAVGDDDQNIYAFRETSNEFIQRFAEDYNASQAFLVHNYRSTQNIIAASNRLIAHNPDRLKIEHPIKIDRARLKQPVGGSWQDIDTITQGKVLILQVADTLYAQAQAVVAEVERKRLLEPDFTWQDVAILARNHAQLEPFAAWCESESIPYQKRGAGQEGKPPLWRIREGKTLLDSLLAAESGVSVATLAKDWSARSVLDPDNDYLALCAAFCNEQAQIWVEEVLSGKLLADAFFEFAKDARRNRSGVLTLSSIHQAKGGEWKHVYILDGGWSRKTPDERRLFYVAMTRARATLTLCQSIPSRGFMAEIEAGNDLLYLDARQQPPAPDSWKSKTLTLGMRDVYISFAGRKGPADKIHVVLEKLRTGAAIRMEQQGERWVLLSEEGAVVGQLAKSCEIPKSCQMQVSVESLVWRSRDDGEGDLNARCEGWWVVLPRIKLD